MLVTALYDTELSPFLLTPTIRKELFMSELANIGAVGDSVPALDNMSDVAVRHIADTTLSLINLSTTDTNRSTHYSTREEFEEVRDSLHRNVFLADRTIYGCVFCLSGVTDFSKQKAVMSLLSNPRAKETSYILSTHQEKYLIDKLVWDLPANRMMNLFNEFKSKRVNNSRTRKTVLPKILNSGNLELWCIKYRRKVKESLEHVWGKRRTSILKSILAKETWNNKESSIVNSLLGSYVSVGSYIPESSTLLSKAQECVSFVLGNDSFKGKSFTLPLLTQFYSARSDLSTGKNLPMEVLEGIRSTYHKDVPKDQVLKTTKDTLTTKQKRLVQKRAESAGVKVEFDPMKYGLVDLFIYAFEMGISDEIVNAIRIKSKKSAESIPVSYPRIGILLDDSFSMSGSAEQKLRPMAVALAMRATLGNIADSVHYITASGGPSFPDKKPLVFPKGHTSLAKSLITLLKGSPDSIFIISDGYENAPAGRLSEVMEAVRSIGIQTPVYLLNPVSSAESSTGIRNFGEHIVALPMSDPQSIGLLMLKGLLEADPRRGLSVMINTVFRKVSFEKRREIE